MRMFAVWMEEKYMVATKGNKRKSKNFYYRHINHSGVVFIKTAEFAHTCPSKNDAEFLIRYLQKRIEEVGILLRE